MGGESLKKMEEASAGNIIGIGGLDDLLFNTGTLSSVEYCPSFAKANMKGTGLIQVAVEPANVADLPTLVEGLKKLDKSDSSVSYFINEFGEYIISTCG
jgi:translation elongation factor EF-G